MNNLNPEIFNVLYTCDARDLTRYLNKSNISFENIGNVIKFSIEEDEYNIEWVVVFKNNRILKAYATCDYSFDSIPNFKKFLSEKFVVDDEDENTNIIIYRSNINANLTLNIDNNDSSKLEINFEYKKKPKKTFYKTDLIAIFRIVIFAIIGLCISVADYLLYYYENILWLNILMAVISVLFMSVTCYILARREKLDKTVAIVISTLGPVICWILVFAALIFLTHKVETDKATRLINCAFWAFYAMPAFIIVILVVLLIACGLAYA